MKHRLHIGHFANIPTANIGSWDISSLTEAAGMFEDTSVTLNNTAMTLHNMDSTLRGWAKLDTAAGESAIQNNVTWGIANYTHSMHISHLTNIPTANILVKGVCMIKHPMHISHLTNIPIHGYSNAKLRWKAF
jgi:hypothetical protein